MNDIEAMSEARAIAIYEAVNDDAATRTPWTHLQPGEWEKWRRAANVAQLAADAQDEWHRGRAAGIEECERVNAELKKLAQQVAVLQKCPRCGHEQTDVIVSCGNCAHEYEAVRQPPQAERVQVTKSFDHWWTENEKSFLADSCHMSEYHMARLIWEAAMKEEK